MSGILVQTVGQCKMQILRYPENFNQTTDVFRFHLSKLGSAFAQLLSRSSIMRVGTSSSAVIETAREIMQNAPHTSVRQLSQRNALNQWRR
jgi:hypothetical protein